MREPRDYIPAGEGQTPEETALRVAARARVQHGIVHDFIPAKGHKLLRRTKDGAKQALDRAMRAQATAAGEMYREAVSKLQKMTPAEAVAFIEQAPFAVMEMYLAAELDHGARADVLNRFAPPDPDVVLKYQALASIDTLTTEE